MFFGYNSPTSISINDTIQKNRRNIQIFQKTLILIQKYLKFYEKKWTTNEKLIVKPNM